MHRPSLVLLALAQTLWATPGIARMTSEDIRKMLIDESVAGAGECACPYSYAWNGRQCADNSVYSKSGRQSVLCYPHDVTWQMIEEARQRRGL